MVLIVARCIHVLPSAVHSQMESAIGNFLQTVHTTPRGHDSAAAQVPPPRCPAWGCRGPGAPDARHRKLAEPPSGSIGPPVTALGCAALSSQHQHQVARPVAVGLAAQADASLARWAVHPAGARTPHGGLPTYPAGARSERQVFEMPCTKLVRPHWQRETRVYSTIMLQRKSTTPSASRTSYFARTRHWWLVAD